MTHRDQFHRDFNAWIGSLSNSELIADVLHGSSVRFGTSQENTFLGLTVDAVEVYGATWQELTQFDLKGPYWTALEGRSVESLFKFEAISSTTCRLKHVSNNEYCFQPMVQCSENNMCNLYANDIDETAEFSILESFSSPSFPQSPFLAIPTPRMSVTVFANNVSKSNSWWSPDNNSDFMEFEEFGDKVKVRSLFLAAYPRWGTYCCLETNDDPFIRQFLECTETSSTEGVCPLFLVDCPSCANGGKCAANEFGNKKCQCVGEFTGPLCECPPCQNGGSCVYGACECLEGFSGEMCECPPCKNGSSCVEGVCACPEGYTGELCDEKKSSVNVLGLVLIGVIVVATATLGLIFKQLWAWIIGSLLLVLTIILMLI